jgi:hypothetical protein
VALSKSNDRFKSNLASILLTHSGSVRLQK